MISELREEVILNTLNENGVLYTQEIMKKCDVSEITIRRDLAKLESKGLLIRTHGGAVKSKVTDILFTYDHKINLNRQSKEYVSRLAVNYINEGDVLFIDCGSTLSLLIPHLARFDFLTVITNSLPVISEFIVFPNIRSLLIGGEIEKKRKAIYGSIAVNNIGLYHANKAFIGADGISLKNGLSSYDEKDAAITQKMIESSDEVFLLCDSSKIEKNSFIKLAPITAIHHLITDKQISPDQLRLYRDYGVDVIIE